MCVIVRLDLGPHADIFCTAKERVGSLNLCPPQERYPKPQTALVALTSRPLNRDLGLSDPVVDLEL